MQTALDRAIPRQTAEAPGSPVAKRRQHLSKVLQWESNMSTCHWKNGAGLPVFMKTGNPIRQIAAALDRPPSTVSRELRRNRGKQVGYKPSYAHEQAKARRWTGSRLERDGELRRLVLDRLRHGWSPEQIAGRLACDKAATGISHESIYRFIYAQIRRTNDGSWRHYLPRAKAKRGWRGRKGGSSASSIKGRVSIAQRPEAANGRAFPGHWEADLMLFKTYGQAILVAHERVSRILILARQPNKAAEPTAANSSPGSSPCHPSCARPSLSTTAPSSPSTTASKPTSVSKPSSAIPTAPGKRAGSRTPSDACAGPCRAKPISPPSVPKSSMPSSPPTTIPHENAWTSKPQPRHSWLNCCTSNVNPPSRFRGNDDVEELGQDPTESRSDILLPSRYLKFKSAPLRDLRQMPAASRCQIHEPSRLHELSPPLPPSAPCPRCRRP